MSDAAGQGRSDGGGSPLTKALDNPIAGMAPWIVLSILEGPGWRFEGAVGLALAMSVFLLCADLVRGRSLKILSCCDVVFFAALLIVGLVISGSGRHWLETWSGEISNVALAVIALGSMALRVPFTIQYAREEVPREYWHSPVFIHTNYVITAVWAGAFLVAAVAGGYGDGVLHDPNNLWTGWVIQIAAILIALKFTEWYPDVAQARAQRAQGEPATVPTIGALLVPMTAWLVPSGILALVFDAGPTWFGVALIIAGVVLSRMFARDGGSNETKPATR